MDKEMMNKVNDVLKAKGMRELSMDEMDKVNGGGDGIIYHIGQCTSEEDINYYVYTFIASIENSFGKDIAADIIKTQISHSEDHRPSWGNSACLQAYNGNSAQ